MADQMGELKNKTLPLPLYLLSMWNQETFCGMEICPRGDTLIYSQTWKTNHPTRKIVMHCANVLIFELGDSQVPINISEIQDQPFLATTPKYPLGDWKHEHLIGLSLSHNLQKGIPWFALWQKLPLWKWTCGFSFHALVVTQGMGGHISEINHWLA